jgi:hypothetical protein
MVDKHQSSSKLTLQSLSLLSTAKTNPHGMLSFSPPTRARSETGPLLQDNLWTRLDRLLPPWSSFPPIAVIAAPIRGMPAALPAMHVVSDSLRILAFGIGHETDLPSVAVVAAPSRPVLLPLLPPELSLSG